MEQLMHMILIILKADIPVLALACSPTGQHIIGHNFAQEGSDLSWWEILPGLNICVSLTAGPWSEKEQRLDHVFWTLSQIDKGCRNEHKHTQIGHYKLGENKNVCTEEIVLNLVCHRCQSQQNKSQNVEMLNYGHHNYTFCEQFLTLSPSVCFPSS